MILFQLTIPFHRSTSIPFHHHIEWKQAI